MEGGDAQRILMSALEVILSKIDRFENTQKEQTVKFSEVLDTLTRKVDELAKTNNLFCKESLLSKSDCDRKRHDEEDNPSTSEGFLKVAIKKLINISSDRKVTTITTHSDDTDVVDKKNSINSSLRSDPNLKTLIESLMQSINDGMAYNDPIEASKHLSNILGCDVIISHIASDIDKLFLQLNSSVESDVQEDLRDKWLSDQILNHSSFVMDTSASNFNAPIFKLPDRLVVKSGSINSGKPDFTSLIAPMFLEIKDVLPGTIGNSRANGAQMKNHEYDVLEQALNRVRVTANQNELLRRIFCFATTGSRSWLVYCERIHTLRHISDAVPSKLQRDAILAETYHIIPITATHILSIWKSVSRMAASDKTYYVHSDAFFLADVLKRMQFDLAYSRVKILGNSGRGGSIMYGVSPGRPYLATQSKRSYMYFSPKASFAIKIHQNQHRGNNEVKILQLLKGCKIAAKYVVGIFSYSFDEKVSSKQVLTFDDFLLARSDTSWNTNSNSSCSSLPSSGGSTDYTLGLRAFHIQTASEESPKSPQEELKFSLESVRKRYGSYVNDWSSANTRLDPRDVWWEFSETMTPSDSLKVDTSSITERSGENHMEEMDTEPCASQTAVLMHISCDRVPLNQVSANHLSEQLVEIHMRRVLHTDTRITNIVPFAIDVDQNGNTVVQEYIIDFDLSTLVEPDKMSAEIDVSHTGARRDLALMTKFFPPGSDANTVQWTFGDDTRALGKCQEALFLNSNASVASISNKNNNRRLTSMNLSDDFNSQNSREKKKSRVSN